MDVSDIRRLQMRLIIDQRFNGKQSAFAAAIERQPDYVSRCLKGTKRIGEEFAGHVERQLGLPDGWMSGVHGVDSLASSRLPAIAEPEPSYLIEASRIIQVPKLAVAASMGPGADQANEEVVTGTLSIVSDWAAKHLPGVKMAGLRFITGYGESMHPTFSSGDVLLVDTSVSTVDVDGIYVLSNDQSLFIKRVTRRLNGQHEITSDNPLVRQTDQLNGEHQVQVLGRVVWLWNGRKA